MGSILNRAPARSHMSPHPFSRNSFLFFLLRISGQSSFRIREPDDMPVNGLLLTLSPGGQPAEQVREWIAARPGAPLCGPQAFATARTILPIRCCRETLMGPRHACARRFIPHRAQRSRFSGPMIAFHPIAEPDSPEQGPRRLRVAGYPLHPQHLQPQAP